MTKRVIEIRDIVAIIFLGSIVLFPVSAQIPERSSVDPPGLEYISLGGASGWGRLETIESATFLRGWRGGDDIVLADQTVSPDIRTDVVARFDHSVGDYDGHYSLQHVAGVSHITHRSRFGGGSIAFDGTGILSLSPLDGSLFTAYAQDRSFVIDVWLYPTGISEGVEVVRWNGAFLQAGSPVLQQFRFHINDGRFRWELKNLIARVGPTGITMESVALSGRRGPVPGRWTHHRLRYDASRAQIAYLVDGVPEAIEYLTDSGGEDSGSYAIVFGDDTGEGLTLGERYRGLIDEFRISFGTDDAVRTTRYSGVRGEIVTAPIPIGDHGGIVHAIRGRVETPGNTGVRLFYRIVDRNYQGEWKRISGAGGMLPGGGANFVQMRAELLADASGNATPRLQEIEIAYQPHSPPPIPRGVTGEGIPGGVRVSWEAAMMSDVQEYRVLFGEHPGRYTGSSVVASPITVPDGTTVTINGLEPDHSYVFAIESVDRYGQRSPISREIEVRAGRSE